MDSTFEMVGLTRLVANLRTTAPTAAITKLRAKMIEIVAEFVLEVKSNLSGTVLKAGNPPRLRDSIKGEVTGSATSVLGRVWSEGVPYAGIQEFGGRTSAHDIAPVNAAALAFRPSVGPLTTGAFPVYGGYARRGLQSANMVFALIVHHPGSDIPERSYMRRTLAQNRTRIMAELGITAQTSIDGAL